ncbi:MAG TPA: ABC transporter permease [Thermoanaerobaculia bacterium]|nr:ABC transporter permease [Thermoanaerobaculia bacterium]
MQILLQDLRFAFRTLLKNSLVSGVSIVTLALGIGATTAIFSVVNAVLLRPLPFRDPDRLVMLWATTPKKDRDTVVPADFFDWRQQTQAFQDLAGFGYMSANLTGGDHPEKATGASVTANFFTTLGVRPALGRVFTPADGTGADKPVVLSYGLWQRALGADPGIVGRTIKINDQAVPVLGVMPAGFLFPERAELWMRAPRDVPELPGDVGGDPATLRGLSYMRAFGRLEPAVAPARAQAELAAVARRQAQLYPKTNADRGVAVVPLYQQLVGDVRAALLVLLGGVFVVLAIACANVANLMVARASAREREIALRTALGAHRSHLVRQLLTESVLMALLGGALGLFLAFWGVKLLVALDPGNVPRLDEVGIDGTILAFSLAVSLLVGIVLGLLPIVHAARLELTNSLKEGGVRAGHGAERLRARALLVVVQVGLALVLSISAALLVKSFLRLQRVKAGFNAAGLMSFQITLPEIRYGEPRQQAAFFTQALAGVRAIPGVESSAGVLTPPLSGDDVNLQFSIEGQPPPKSDEEQRDGYQAVSTDYFKTMGIPLLKGRVFTAADMNDSARSVILSEAMARRYWPHADPLGKRITYNKATSPTAKWRTVVGVVGDVRHFGLDQAARAEVYVPYPQIAWPMMYLVVRSAGDPLNLVPQIRAQIARVDPNVPIASVNTFDQLLARSFSRQRFTSFLLGVFAAISLLLAAVGLYAVMAYSVGQRVHEIGIRIVLGAQRGDVVGQVVRQGMWLAAAGVAAGLLGAFAFTRVLRSLLFEVAPTDSLAFVGIPLVLLLVALLANSLPALRAARIDPVVAMRYE